MRSCHLHPSWMVWLVAPPFCAGNEDPANPSVQPGRPQHVRSCDVTTWGDPRRPWRLSSFSINGEHKGEVEDLRMASQPVTTRRAGEQLHPPSDIHASNGGLHVALDAHRRQVCIKSRCDDARRTRDGPREGNKERRLAISCEIGGSPEKVSCLPPNSRSKRWIQCTSSMEVIA